MNKETVNIEGFTSSVVSIGLMVFSVYLFGTIGTWWAGAAAILTMVGIGYIIYRLAMSFAEAGIKLGMKVRGDNESSTSW